MSLRAFTYAAETLRLQQQERFHVETPADTPVPSAQEMRQRNAESMKAFAGLMSGVSGAPQVGAKRR